jgi:hypothetical protein
MLREAAWPGRTFCRPNSSQLSDYDDSGESGFCFYWSSLLVTFLTTPIQTSYIYLRRYKMSINSSLKNHAKNCLNSELPLFCQVKIVFYTFIGIKRG